MKNPNKFLTPACFWSMTNSQYFPYGAYLLATDEEANETMITEIKEAAKNVPDDPISGVEELTSVDALVYQ